MDKFEEYIKARYPVDYEHLKEKYPNVPVGEFYGDEKDLWNYRQADLEEKDKRIEALIAQIEMSDFKDSLGHKLKSNLAYLDLKALRGEHEA